MRSQTRTPNRRDDIPLLELLKGNSHCFFIEATDFRHVLSTAVDQSIPAGSAEQMAKDSEGRRRQLGVVNIAAHEHRRCAFAHGSSSV
jgi:hypothetical protein